MVDRVDLTQSQMLQAFFVHLNRAGLPYVVVGDVRDFPAEVAGDVDFVVPQARLGEVRSLIENFAAAQGVAVVQVLQHEASAFYTCLGWIGPEGYTILKLDYCGDYVRHARLLLPAAILVEQATRQVFGAGPDDYFNAPWPGAAMLYYVSKRLDKGEFTPRNSAYLATLWASAPGECAAAFAQVWSDADRPALDALIAGADDATQERHIAALRRSLYASRPRRIADIARDQLRRVGRVLRPTGIVVAVMGPDGSGKSLVINTLLEQQQDGFRRIKYVHLRPRLLGASQDAMTPTSDPHAKLAYGRGKSAVKLAYVVADYLLGYWAKILPAKGRSTFIVFDRYYHDMLVDPRRSRYGGPAWLVRAFGVIVPKPDLMLILDAEVATIMGRKAEVTPEECARQVEAYRQLASDYDFAELIDANQTPAEVAASANAAIARFMADRTRLYHG